MRILQRLALNSSTRITIHLNYILERKAEKIIRRNKNKTISQITDYNTY